ncbi:MAG: class I SAM-dependent methyltransferase [Chlamydiae bacterium]|nr:class I SAM-dependent methyltransferase [Chlamydiota bacterium]
MLKKLLKEQVQNPQRKNNTGWGHVGTWYDEVVEDRDSYQEQVIKPNLIRLLDVKKGENILDLACGQGFFSRSMHELGATVTGVDIGKELLEIAKEKSSKDIRYLNTSADNLKILRDGEFDKAICVLAMQNIEHMQKTISEVSRVLKSGGSFYLILNHPTIRIPQKSSWGFDESMNVQYRRLDSYMSEFKSEIVMNPGDSKRKQVVTYSFHFTSFLRNRHSQKNPNL